MKRRFGLFVAGMVLLLACSGNAETASTPLPETSPTSKITAPEKPTTPPISSTQAVPLGTLRLETEQVLHGPDAAAMVPLLEAAPFYVLDLVQVIDGGEALLDFGDRMELRLFNDTELGMVSAEAAEGVPLGVELFLYFGGFTGELVEEGGEVVIQTPGGAVVTVLGTEYFVTYAPEDGETVVGNFGGTVTVAGSGTEVELGGGTYIVVPDGGPPGLALPLPVTREEFEANARESGSPVQAAEMANSWTLEIRHAFNYEYEGAAANGAVFTSLRLWSGQFSVIGDQVVGKGTGSIEDLNILCTTTDHTLISFDLKGNFDFDLDGRVIANNREGPIFFIELSASNLTMTDLTSISELGTTCNFFSEFIQVVNQAIVEDLVSSGITATAGETVELLLDGDYEIDVLGNVSRGSEITWYFAYPLDVTVSQTR